MKTCTSLPVGCAVLLAMLTVSCSPSQPWISDCNDTSIKQEVVNDFLGRAERVYWLDSGMNIRKASLADVVVTSHDELTHAYSCRAELSFLYDPFGDSDPASLGDDQSVSYRETIKYQVHRTEDTQRLVTTFENHADILADIGSAIADAKCADERFRRAAEALAKNALKQNLPSPDGIDQLSMEVRNSEWLPDTRSIVCTAALVKGYATNQQVSAPFRFEIVPGSDAFAEGGRTAPSVLATKDALSSLLVTVKSWE